MLRRVVYALIGTVTVNLGLMVAMFVHAQHESSCDTSARGLVFWYDDRDRWLLVQAPAEPTDLPPCKGTFETELSSTSARTLSYATS